MCRTGSARGLEEQQADHARTDHENGVTRPHRRHRHAVERDCNCLQHGCLGKGEIVGQRVEDARWHHQVLGKGAVASILGAGDAHDLTLVA